MDKKNTAIGVALLIAAFASMYVVNRFSPPPPPAPATTPAVTASTPAGTTTAAAPAATTPSTPGTANPTGAAFSAASTSATGAQIVTLENDFIRVTFTSAGGAIETVALKKFPAELHGVSPYIFNEHRVEPILAFVDYPGLDQQTPFAVVSQTGAEIVYRAVFKNSVEVTRRYTLVTTPDKAHDPYQIRHETTFRNLTDQPEQLGRIGLSVGTAAPVNETVYGRVVASGFSTGKDRTFHPVTDLAAGGGVFGIGAHEARASILNGGPIAWSTVDNQFFASILTPDQPAAGHVTRRVKLRADLPDHDPVAYGLAATTQFDPAPLAPKAESQLAATLYVGPKEYHRLANTDAFKADEDKVMQFGTFFGFFSQILNTLMTWMHGFTGNWGVAIILTTLTLKFLSLPLTLSASRSAKRMQKIQPEMQAIREKFKDNPQKLQTATMELFKKHKVNPLGGCIPILITLPFFFGFFTMLRSTAELRFVPFLWAADLSAPDTVGHLFGLPINIMPILMGATMIIQQHLTPMPNVDNAQAKMMKFMPYVFALFCYTFSCALALYSTVNGIFTIGQQLIINRMKDDGDPAAAPATVTPSGKIVKNVTPKKK